MTRTGGFVAGVAAGADVAGVEAGVGEVMGVMGSALRCGYLALLDISGGSGAGVPSQAVTRVVTLWMMEPM